MKRKNRRDVFNDDELAVADILLRLPEIILTSDSRRQVGWKVKKKRSVIEQILPSTTTTCQNVTNPVTPLSCKGIKVSYKKKKEYWSKMVDDLTHQGELLKSEIENVKRLRDRMKAVNSELKTKKQQCNLSMAMAEAEAGVVVDSGEQVVVQPQPLQLFPCHPDHLTIASTSGSDAANPVGPYVTPQENILGLDLNLSLNISLDADADADAAQVLKRTEAAAQARKKRLQICKVKKPPSKTASCCFIH